MMRILLLFSLFLISQGLQAQHISLHLEELIYDFGYLKESEGKVSHTFFFTNNEKERIEITQVAASCGCMLPKASGRFLDPGERGFVTVEYDPAGRPGKFIKSLEITVKSPSKGNHTYFINVKGVVIGKEVLPAYEEDWKKHVLLIRPFIAPVVSGTDFRFLNDPRLQNFINDLTYEIDMNNFATVRLELMLPSPELSEEMSASLFLPIKKFIQAELSRRNYFPFQVTFSDTKYSPLKSSMIPSDALALIKISSLEQNNDSIPESGFFFVKGENPTFLQKEKAKAHEDSMRYKRLMARYFEQSPFSTQGIDPKFSSVDVFVQQGVRQVLMNGSIQISIRIESTCPSSQKKSEEAVQKKLVKKVQEQIVAYFDDNGIDKSKIQFTIPNLLVIEKDVPLSRKLHVSQVSKTSVDERMDPQEWLLSINDSTERKEIIGAEGKAFKPPFQDLPTYQHLFTVKNPTLDTTAKSFRFWANLMAKEIRSGKKIRFLIESSASTAITQAKTDPYYLSRSRAKSTQQLILGNLLKRAVGKELLKFMEPIALVQGPDFDSREFGVSFCDQFHYVKIIPVYDSVFSTPSDLFPYQVNFNRNYFELPAQSEVFQVFVNRLIPEIDRMGYVKLIFESSSSFAPAQNFSNNKTVSYFRAESAKNKLREEIRKRGYDPRRLIIVEERTLVQGPPYTPGDDLNSPVFQRYQYIKIIPEALIRN